MKIVFADTGYWIAMINKKDSLHQKARQVTLEMNPIKIITSEMILSELLDSFSKQGLFLKQATVNLINRSYDNPNIDIIQQNPQLFKQALNLYNQRLDQQWSHTDCSSFIIMQNYQIREALAYDKHFEQAGFIALLRT
ncbi:nucleic acid-binding protein [Crocosphaera sp.]|uniref:type II toxin-antitoxin system VapC family toxin n=1 Tax=Crocosphaera sp. TaxID=2729996 RepID=UPI0026340FD5|nr:nucleic acid-binding protein [Crocosphaera sp.]MDJ0578441.1 nucleic acid-binding protein [Crocosphaera sp.]